MTRISSFFRELSEDNDSITALVTPQLNTFILGFANIITIESCEFVGNLAVFYFNMLEKSGALGSLYQAGNEHMNFFRTVIQSIT